MHITITPKKVLVAAVFLGAMYGLVGPGGNDTGDEAKFSENDIRTVLDMADVISGGLTDAEIGQIESDEGLDAAADHIADHPIGDSSGMMNRAWRATEGGGSVGMGSVERAAAQEVLNAGFGTKNNTPKP